MIRKAYTKITRQNRYLNTNAAGSVLVIIILSIVIVASIGTAILTGTSNATFTQLGSVDTMNGYFLAETGKTYATSYLITEMKDGTSPDAPTTGTMALLNSKEFSIPKTSASFKLSLSHSYCDGSSAGANDCPCPGTTCTYHLKVTGKPTPSAERTVTYIIQQNM